MGRTHGLIRALQLPAAVFGRPVPARIRVEDVPPTMTSPASPEPTAAGLVLAVDLPAGRLVLTGELDRGTCGHLLAVSPLLAAAAAPVWVLDVAGLTFCDAAGLRALTAVRRAAADAGAAVVAVGARPFLRWLLTFAGLGDVLAPVPAACRAAAVRPASPHGAPARRAATSGASGRARGPGRR